MPWSREPSFRDVAIQQAHQVGAGGMFGYWHFKHPQLASYGVKNANPSIGSMLSARTYRKELLKNVSHLAILTDPLRGLEVGQRIGEMRGDTGEKLYLHHHEPGKNLLQVVHTPHWRDIFQGKHWRDYRQVETLRQLNAIPDEKLEEWLGVVNTLDERGFSIDTIAQNILFAPGQLKWIDVDDPRAQPRLPTGIFSASQHNHAEAIIKNLSAILGTMGIEHGMKEESYYGAAITEEWQKLRARIVECATRVGLPATKAEYLARQETQPFAQRQLPKVLAEIPMDAPVSFVASELKRHHARNASPETGRNS